MSWLDFVLELPENSAVGHGAALSGRAGIFVLDTPWSCLVAIPDMGA